MLDFFSSTLSKEHLRDDTVKEEKKRKKDQTNNKSPFGKNGNK